jgi:N-acetyl-anhydromuramyl-L-alanine amidase AmpD
MKLNNFNIEDDPTSDLSETPTALFSDCPLPNGEYVKEKFEKKTIFLHHTLGWHNPERVIRSWGRDSRGRVGTAFVIGGQSVKANDSKYDGSIYRAFDEDYWAFHLGTRKYNAMAEKESIGIELCSFGPLTKTDKGYVTYTGTLVDKSQVEILDEPYKGYTAWHMYSDAQIEATVNLIQYLCDKYNIDPTNGLITRVHDLGFTKAFEFDSKVRSGNVESGIYTHGMIRTSKSDIYPCKELVKKLSELV